MFLISVISLSLKIAKIPTMLEKILNFFFLKTQIFFELLYFMR